MCRAIAAALTSSIGFGRSIVMFVWVGRSVADECEYRMCTW
jgi:hypothetical protein